MNQLKMSLKQSIISLAAASWSQRRIARELRVHRETVGKYLHEARASKPAISPAGSEAEESSKPAIPPPRLSSGTDRCRSQLGCGQEEPVRAMARPD